MKLRPLVLLLVLVLLVHWAGLSWLGDQSLLGKSMVLMPDPLFTRTIAPGSAPAPAAKAVGGAKPSLFGDESSEDEEAAAVAAAAAGRRHAARPR